MGAAVWGLHAMVFQPYRAWATQVRVEAFPPLKTSTPETLSAEDLGSAETTNVALLDLCLYFGLWTEAANLRHTPELVWFLFWCMRHSENFDQLEGQRCPSPWALERNLRGNLQARQDLVQLRDRRVAVRNDWKSIIDGITVRAQPSLSSSTICSVGTGSLLVHGRLLCCLWHACMASHAALKALCAASPMHTVEHLNTRSARASRHNQMSSRHRLSFI